VEASDKFRFSLTLRFPRFKGLKKDKRWDQALSVQEFLEMKSRAETEKSEKEKDFKIEQSRRKKARTTKKPLTVAGNDTVCTPYAGPASKVFDGLSFYIMTEQMHPTKKSKADLEALVKANGGKVVQRDSMDKDLVIVADKRLIKVASLEKRATNNIVKPVWIQDCIRQNEIDAGSLSYLLPFEPNRHMFYLHDDDQLDYENNVDKHGDSYARDIADVEEMRRLLCGISEPDDASAFEREEFLDQLEDHGESFAHVKTHTFSTVKAAFHNDPANPAELFRVQLARNYIQFGGGLVTDDLDAGGVTHVIVLNEQSSTMNARGKITGLARIVGVSWVEKCWEEGTMVDEERYQWG
jgi:DNA ligase-4